MISASKKGFTLVEMLAVIVLLGIVLGIGLPTYTRGIANAKLRAAAGELQQDLEVARTSARTIGNDKYSASGVSGNPVFEFVAPKEASTGYNIYGFMGNSYIVKKSVAFENGITADFTAFTTTFASPEKATNCLWYKTSGSCISCPTDNAVLIVRSTKTPKTFNITINKVLGTTKMVEN